MSPERCPLAVLADFQAFQRFEIMNQRADSTAWSRDCEARLRSKLEGELGDAFKYLRFLPVVILDKSACERHSVQTISAALKLRVDRDRPRTFPSDGLDFS